MKKWHHERRWKTRVGVAPAEMARVLNRLSAKGWTIQNILPQGAWRFLVVGTRTVRVYE